AHQSEVFFDALICTALAMSTLVLIVFLGRSRLDKIPGKLQNVLEWAVESLRGLTTDLLGPQGPKYLPLMGTLFLYIFFANLIGLVPGMKSPTMTVSTTLALGITTFLSVQAIAIKVNGVVGYLKHFMGDILALAPLMFVIHIFGEIAKPMSLSLRLFGNIYGEDNITAVLLKMGYPAWIPVHLPMLAFGIFTAFLQAFIFTSLSCIYVQGFTEHAGHDEHHDDNGHGHGHEHGQGHAHDHAHAAAHAH
ncbi:MAG: F0F1 ATP synthase subunit A, partial [Planctomycetes bacterium]|nr:F0F1 ATP synthase subunit A [Planctomycetota bacterium]